MYIFIYNIYHHKKSTQVQKPATIQWFHRFSQNCMTGDPSQLSRGIQDGENEFTKGMDYTSGYQLKIGCFLVGSKQKVC